MAAAASLRPSVFALNFNFPLFFLELYRKKTSLKHPRALRMIKRKMIKFYKLTWQ